MCGTAFLVFFTLSAQALYITRSEIYKEKSAKIAVFGFDSTGTIDINVTSLTPVPVTLSSITFAVCTTKVAKNLFSMYEDDALCIALKDNCEYSHNFTYENSFNITTPEQYEVLFLFCDIPNYIKMEFSMHLLNKHGKLELSSEDSYRPIVTGVQLLFIVSNIIALLVSGLLHLKHFSKVQLFVFSIFFFYFCSSLIEIFFWGFYLSGSKLTQISTSSKFFLVITDATTMAILMLIGKGYKLIYLRVHFYEMKLLLCGFFLYCICGILECFWMKYFGIGNLVIILFLFLPSSILSISSSNHIIKCHSLAANSPDLHKIFHIKKIMLQFNLVVIGLYVIMNTCTIIMTYSVPIDYVIIDEVVECFLRLLLMLLLSLLLKSRPFVFKPLEIDKRSYKERIVTSRNRVIAARRLINQLSNFNTSFIDFKDILLVGTFTSVITDAGKEVLLSFCSSGTPHNNPTL
ncbi:hypothetical protein EIN_173810 [Entamoeba invadens IP1]|uniref:Intimal thickness related receptor IRP domain-containing protein n=1 Tax=Entamoeba invadens IP1 TaxID=370355 RepID=A0A0A1TW51_ENTIV|nr:hypothetical protein EIN_173810 [Entamoeba invadens IP1]ELP84706.1 hypothetical protein EIN_173810 [Entamoeba invadens IP1]|eukprot:XP_004184052.1 hypothetical protein EIN_173810 [Entamoeba invadens IP1]